MIDTLTDNLHDVIDAGPPPRIDAQAILRGGRRRQHRRQAGVSGGVAILAVGVVGGAVVVPAAIKHGDSDKTTTLGQVQAPSYLGQTLPPVVHSSPVGPGRTIALGGGATASVATTRPDYPQVTLSPGRRGSRPVTIGLGRVTSTLPEPVCVRPRAGARIVVVLRTTDASFGELILGEHRFAVHEVRVGGRYSMVWIVLPSNAVISNASKVVLGTRDAGTDHASLSASRLNRQVAVLGGVPAHNC